MNETGQLTEAPGADPEVRADAPFATAASARPALRLAYLTNQYPKVSHTFIRREIRQLERMGYEVMRVSIRDTRTNVADDEDRDEATKTYVCLAQSWLAFAQAVAACIVRRPLGLLRATRMTLAMGRYSERGMLRHFAYLVEACLLSEVFRQRSIDHVHVHFGTNAATVARLIRCLTRLSYSMTVHGPGEFDAPRGYSLREKVQDAAFTVAISSYCAAQIRRWSRYEDWPRIHIVRCTINERFECPPTPIESTSRELLSIGRLTPQKGQLLLLDALAELVAQGCDAKLVLAGDGEMRTEVDRRIADLGLSARVRITGWVDEETVRTLLRSCRALVQPSFAEGLPVVIMEALAMARPVIATRITGIPELVKDGESGWLVTAGDVPELVIAMREVLETPVEELFSMGMAGRARVMSAHRAESVVAGLADLFERYVVTE